MTGGSVKEYDCPTTESRSPPSRPCNRSADRTDGLLATRLANTPVITIKQTTTTRRGVKTLAGEHQCVGANNIEQGQRWRRRGATEPSSGHKSGAHLTLAETVQRETERRR